MNWLVVAGSNPAIPLSSYGMIPENPRAEHAKNCNRLHYCVNNRGGFVQAVTCFGV